MRRVRGRRQIKKCPGLICACVGLVPRISYLQMEMISPSVCIKCRWSSKVVTNTRWVRCVRTWRGKPSVLSCLCPTRTQLKNPLKNCGFATYAQSFWLAKLRLLETLAFELSRLLPSCSLRICLTTAVALNACWNVGGRKGGEEEENKSFQLVRKHTKIACFRLSRNHEPCKVP